MKKELLLGGFLLAAVVLSGCTTQPNYENYPGVFKQTNQEDLDLIEECTQSYLTCKGELTYSDYYTLCKSAYNAGGRRLLEQEITTACYTAPPA